MRKKWKEKSKLDNGQYKNMENDKNGAKHIEVTEPIIAEA